MSQGYPPPTLGGKGLCPMFRAELCSPQNLYVEVKLCLLKFICWSSKPWDLRMWLYLKIGFLKKGLIKMRSLGWILVQCDWSPHKMGEFRHRDAHRRKMMWRWLFASQGEKSRTDPSLQALRGIWLCWNLDLGLPAFKTVRKQMLS